MVRNPIKIYHFSPAWTFSIQGYDAMWLHKVLSTAIALLTMSSTSASTPFCLSPKRLFHHLNLFCLSLSLAKICVIKLSGSESIVPHNASRKDHKQEFAEVSILHLFKSQSTRCGCSLSNVVWKTWRIKYAKHRKSVLNLSCCVYQVVCADEAVC